jgi:hypothetical protein
MAEAVTVRGLSALRSQIAFNVCGLDLARLDRIRKRSGLSRAAVLRSLLLSYLDSIDRQERAQRAR